MEMGKLAFFSREGTAENLWDWDRRSRLSLEFAGKVSAPHNHLTTRSPRHDLLNFRLQLIIGERPRMIHCNFSRAV